MRPARSTRLTGIIAAGVMFVCWFPGTVAAADRLEGLQVGPWLLSPYLITGYEYDSNPLFRPGESESEKIGVVTPGFGAVLPVRNSSFLIQVEHSIYDYERLTLGDNSVTEIDTGLKLAFSSFDQLEIGFQRTSGLARTTRGFDEGGEAVFQGDTFNLNTYSMDLSRAIYGHRGYQVRLARKDMVFDPGSTASFFDYRGWEYRGEYREPIGPRRWLFASLEGRMYDHFQVDDPVGQLFRQEDSKMTYLGVEGKFSPQISTRARLGYGDFRFPFADGSDFQGMIGDLSADFQSVSRRIEIHFLGSRRPNASFFFNNTHYVHTSLQLNVEARVWTRVTVGGRAQSGVSEYGDALENPGDPQEGLIRKDRIRSVEFYGNMMLSPLFGITVSARGSRRTSNYEGVEYVAKSLFAGLVVGWR